PEYSGQSAWQRHQDDQRIQPRLEIDRHQEIDEQDGKADPQPKLKERLVHALHLTADDDRAGFANLPFVLFDNLVDLARDGAEVGALDAGVNVEERLHVIVVERQRGDRPRKIGQVAQQLRRRLPRDGDGSAMQLVEGVHPVLLRLDHDLVAHAVFVVEPEIGRRRSAAGQRDQQVVGDVPLRQADLLGEDTVTIDHDPRRVEDLLHVHVHRTRDAFELVGDLLGDLEILIRFRQGARDLYVDGGGQAEVEDLADDVGRLSEEFEIRKPARQLVAERLQVSGGRAVRRVERHQDLSIGRPNRDTVAERQVDRVRQADVVDDHVELVGGDHLADIVLDLLEVDLCLLDPRSRRSPDMEPELTRIDRREEVPANERVQEQRGDRKGKKH